MILRYIFCFEFIKLDIMVDYYVYLLGSYTS